MEKLDMDKIDQLIEISCKGSDCPYYEGGGCSILIGLHSGIPQRLVLHKGDKIVCRRLEFVETHVGRCGISGA